MLGFIGVGSGKFDQHLPSAVSRERHPFQQSFNISGTGGKKGCRGESDIDKSLHSRHFGDVGVRLQKFSDRSHSALGTAAELGDFETVDGKIPFLPCWTGFKGKGLVAGKGGELGPQSGLQIFKELHRYVCLSFTKWF